MSPPPWDKIEEQYYLVLNTSNKSPYVEGSEHVLGTHMIPSNFHNNPVSWKLLLFVLWVKQQKQRKANLFRSCNLFCKAKVGGLQQAGPRAQRA